VDRQELERAALEHIDSVYRMALHLARRPEDAADLVQETYLKALHAADRFEQRGGGVRPWLFKILHNVFYSKLARARREPRLLEDAATADGRQPPPGGPGPAWDLASLDWEHVDDRLKRAIEGLRPEYRTILLLWGVEGLKYREIAEILDVPIGTVMSRLHRARSILARELHDLREETGLP
jgi:RNA polymerase sigma-70 factor (ECF subfamily)